MKQTIQYKLNTNYEQEKHLHNLCSIATKLYNTDNYQRREEWEKTGKIPNVYAQKKALKNNIWFKSLPSQTAQEVCFNLQRNYKSWFKLRKKYKEANPPRFRKKDVLSPLTFYQQFKIIEDKLRIIMSREYSKEKGFKFIEVGFEKWKEGIGKAKMCQILLKKGKWYVNVVYETAEPEVQINDKVMAIDIGIINLASVVDNQGNSKIYSGKQALAVQHYFNSRIARVQSKLTKQFPKRHKSKCLNNLYQKKKRQINQILHIISKRIVEQAKENNIKTIVIGDIKDIRKDKHFRKKESQKLHSWSFSKLTQQIGYKSTLSGIRFVCVSEENTSKTCSYCNNIRKSNRITRGLYKCKFCGRTQNADTNGAINILKKYLQLFPKEDRSIDCVAQSLVERVNVIPLSQEAHTF